MARILFPFLIFVHSFLIGCGSGISDKNLSYVSPSEASVLMREGNRALLGPGSESIMVDPRPTWSYRKSHILGAINIPFGRLHIQSWRLDDAGIIIVAGETYNDPIAVAMSKELLLQGFTNVKTLRGGLTGWDEAGEPIETRE
ncbi:MAG: rhodanese-like domain-containing protein [Phycisphaerales bacterium]|jgi:rhodanese-related sulfurtransferase|nr:rhodanese-like domain-containing protein [Phycisphaerales bacterium]|tara:strand:- start:1361 stop:1789 length:429 start_codon:yes stop_codon:yes gene_type:complete